MINVDDPEFLWSRAIWLWRDYGTVDTIAVLIREGIPIPTEHRALIADILTGNADRGVKPNHKTYRYKTGLEFRKNQSILLKASILHSRKVNNRPKRRGVSLDDEVAQELMNRYDSILKMYGVSVTAKTVRHDTQGQSHQIEQLMLDVYAELLESYAQDSPPNNGQIN